MYDEESSEIASVRASSVRRKSIKTQFTNRQIDQRGAPAIAVRQEFTNKHSHKETKRNLSKIYEEESETNSDAEKLEKINNEKDNNDDEVSEDKKVRTEDDVMNMKERCSLSRFVPLTKNIS